MPNKLRTILKVNIHHDELGHFASYNHISVIDDSALGSIKAYFSKIAPTPAFKSFARSILGKTFDLRILPYGVTSVGSTHVETREGFIVGKDTLTLSTKLLSQNTALPMANAFAEHMYQNLILMQSKRYSGDMLHVNTLRGDRLNANIEAEAKGLYLRDIFRNLVTSFLIGDTSTMKAAAIKFPHTHKLVTTLLKGDYFAKTA